MLVDTIKNVFIKIFFFLYCIGRLLFEGNQSCVNRNKTLNFGMHVNDNIELLENGG